MTRETRHYTVLGLIGRGGQGNVYHARLQDAVGFRKDVAIKVLKEGLSEESLQRFRDEARILGLVRDRAIVNVDPPIRLTVSDAGGRLTASDAGRLAGRWALVMELADGVSTQLLLERCGPLPIRVALEIVAEVARVLDKLYRAVGPDGQPLHLLHRDIKPGNIQITTEGELKLLDFGVARANFDERETHTVQHIGGTIGFIAPERLRGVNSPACDIYSLGVTLRVLLTGERPATMGPATLAAISPELNQAMTLAERMRHDDPAQRPSAQEVERQARELWFSIAGPTLREWAIQVMPGLKVPMEDPLVGSVLTEDFEFEGALLPGYDRSTPPPALSAMAPPALAPPPRLDVRAIARKAMPVLAVALVMWAMTVGALGFLFGQWWLRPTDPAVAASEPLPPLAAPEPAPDSEGGEPEAPEPALASDPSTAGSSTTRPSKAPSGEAPSGEAPSATAPSPSPARPEPKPKAPTPSLAMVDFTSVVPAEVWVDDERIGTTPLYDQPIPVGTHRIRLSAREKSIETTVMVGGRRGATRFDWDGGSAIGAR